MVMTFSMKQKNAPYQQRHNFRKIYTNLVPFVKIFIWQWICVWAWVSDHQC